MIAPDRDAIPPPVDATPALDVTALLAERDVLLRDYAGLRRQADAWMEQAGRDAERLTSERDAATMAASGATVRANAAERQRDTARARVRELDVERRDLLELIRELKGSDTEPPSEELPLVALVYDFDGGIFTRDGAQMHEETVPDVTGRTVHFHFTVLLGHMEAAVDAVKSVVEWLLEDRGARGVTCTYTVHDPTADALPAAGELSAIPGQAEAERREHPSELPMVAGE